MNAEANLEREKKMYGCSEAELHQAIKDAFNIKIMIAGACSDAQELMAIASQTADHQRKLHYLEQARQYLNRVKFWLMHYTAVRTEFREGKVSFQ